MKEVKILSSLLNKNCQLITERKDFIHQIDGIEKFLSERIICPPFVNVINFSESSEYILSTDIIGSIPIFYLELDNEILISDCTNDFADICNLDFDILAVCEYRALGFTTGSSTLLTKVKQLQAGEYMYISQGVICKGFYSRHLSNSIRTNSFQIEKEALKGVIMDTFRELIDSIGNRHAVISLSGGFDSRLLVYCFKKLGFSNFSCFTYGRTNNVEIENARRTCEQLGIDWTFIDYTTLPIKNYLHTDTFKDYYIFMANHSSMFFMQDYFAIQFLKENKKVPDDAVFIPGHTGDVLSGGHLTPVLKQKLSLSRISREIFKLHYNLTETDFITRRKLHKLITQNLSGGYPSHLIYEDWELRGRQAKFIVNSARVYQFFGYSYFLPLWDNRLLNFFKSLPFELKLKRLLYKKTLIELFAELNLNFQKEIIPTRKEIVLHSIKQLVGAIFPILKRFKKLSMNDKLCYREITDCMLQELIEENVKVHHYYFYNGVIVQWYLYKVTGKV